MGVIDWVILAVLLFFGVQGFRKGFVASLINIGAMIASFILVGQFYPLVRNSLILKFQLSSLLATIFAVVLILIMLAVIARLLIYMLHGVLKAVHLDFINKVLGLALGFVHGLLVVIVVMVVLDYLPSVTAPLKDSAKHRVYAGVDVLKEEVFSSLKLKQRDKYLELQKSDKQDKDLEKPLNEQ